MDHLPVAIKLTGRDVKVIGGGRIALRKINNLLESGALVRVIAPSLNDDVIALYEDGRVTWDRRRFKDSDIDDAVLIISATDDREVNERVSRAARDKGIFVNVVDQPGISDFISPAVIRKDKAIIAVYTDGKDPIMSRDLKAFLKERWDDFISYRSGS